MATASADWNMDACAVCLEAYRKPKFLPCYHTFCAQCIADIADRHTGNTFPCPSCRKPTSLPEGGVNALQSNFYIQTLIGTRDQKTQSQLQSHVDVGTQMCAIHKNKELEFYCLKCDEVICLNCKLTKHEQHDTEDFQTSVEEGKKELINAKDRLQSAMAVIIQRIESTKEEPQAVLDKKAAMEKNIRERHATIVAAADKLMDEALGSLNSVTTDIESRIAKTLKQQEDSLAELINIQERLQKAVGSEIGRDVITTAKEMRSGCGSEQAVNKLTSPKQSPIFRPVLDFNVTTDVIVQKIQDYLGSVTKVELEAATPDMTVVEQFRCGVEGTNTEVFSLCPLDQNPPVVYVSYERCGLKKDAPRQKFTQEGKVLHTFEETGKVSQKRYTEGKGLVANSGLTVYTYCKSSKAGLFKLNQRLSEPGKASIVNVIVITTDPFKAEEKKLFNIKVGAHRAVDVDDSEQLFVVVEEAQLPDMWRKVRLYRCPEEKAVSTYSPPTSSFQPSDVCFYKLDGQKVLLVTDELNDAIHVVKVRNRQMNFVRYLAPGCPLLIQPTAINFDVSGRLWLACRGGSIISMEPSVSHSRTEEEMEDEDYDEEGKEKREEIVSDLLKMLRELD